MTTPIAFADRGIAQPGQGRLRLVAAYFRIVSGLSAIIAAGATATALFPRLGWHTTPVNPWLAAAGAAVMAFGFHRTAQALRQRRRLGAVAALITFASSFAPVVSGSASTVVSAGVSAIGIAALVSVWRHLD